jgi:hypothetical protein
MTTLQTIYTHVVIFIGVPEESLQTETSYKQSKNMELCQLH